jgi:putative transposase
MAIGIRSERRERLGAFSVSESNLESVTAYILNQAEHPKKFSYQEEIREIFKRHRVAFDERYVWD